MNVRATCAAAGIALLSVGVLTGCSSGSTKAATASATAGSTASSSAGVSAAGPYRSGQAGRGMFNDAKVQACLKAAGIAVPTFRRPSGAPTGSPPSGARPTGGFPTGARRSGAGFGGTQSTQFRTALKACGITLPTGGRYPGRTGTPTPSPTGAPSASPSS